MNKQSNSISKKLNDLQNTLRRTYIGVCVNKKQLIGSFEENVFNVTQLDDLNFFCDYVHKKFLLPTTVDNQDPDSSDYEKIISFSVAPVNDTQFVISPGFGVSQNLLQKI